MSDNVDCVVIGAGVVSLAVVRLLAFQGLDMLVLQAAHTTSITLAWAAKARLYGYYVQRGIHYRRSQALSSNPD